MLGIFSHLPWFTQWLDEFVDFIGLGLASINIANVIIGRRVRDGSMSRDLMFHIVCLLRASVRVSLTLTRYKNGEDGEGIIQRNNQQLVVEGLAAIIAGYVAFPRSPFGIGQGFIQGNRSDTTAVTLSNLWYYLLTHPVYYKRLQQEVDATFLLGEDPIDQDRLARMEFLNACINETLRLAPPVPSGSQRRVPPNVDGKLVGLQSVSQAASHDLFHLLMMPCYCS